MTDPLSAREVEIMEIVERLQLQPERVHSGRVHFHMRLAARYRDVAELLADMAKKGLLVYDRKASGWRRG